MAVSELLTIGYGGRSTEEFVSLLQGYRVLYLADVRTKPFSKFQPFYSRDALAPILKRFGIVYVFLGDTLGGLPSDSSCYTGGKVDYTKVRAREWFAKGLERLADGLRQGHRIAIMCAELEPERCHRSKLIGASLAAHGFIVKHIDADGSLISQDAAISRLTGGQSLLFSDSMTSRRVYRPVGSEEQG